jgi:hypothetical protein
MKNPFIQIMIFCSIMAVNQIILQKIDEYNYDEEIKKILKLILDHEDSKASHKERTFTQQYDKIISTYVKL